MSRIKGTYGTYSEHERIPLENGLSANGLRQLAMERGFDEPKPQGISHSPSEPTGLSAEELEQHCAEHYAQLLHELD